MQDPTYILSAERFGIVKAQGGKLDIGGLKVPWDGCAEVHVYVRRSSSDLRVLEIHMTSHDGLFKEALDRQNEEAEHHPLGVKEYWRSAMVGKYTFGPDQHVMTDEDFEAEWEDDE